MGLFNTLFNDLQNDEIKFFNYFRMSSASFDILLGKLKDTLQLIILVKIYLYQTIVFPLSSRASN